MYPFGDGQSTILSYVLWLKTVIYYVKSTKTWLSDCESENFPMYTVQKK